jgi:hypothetical protein
LASWKSECLGPDPNLDPKLFTSQVGSGSRSKTRQKMASGSEKNCFGSTTLVTRFSNFFFFHQTIPHWALIHELKSFWISASNSPRYCMFDFGMQKSCMRCLILTQQNFDIFRKIFGFSLVFRKLRIKFWKPECRIVRHPVSLVPDWKQLTMLQRIRYRCKATQSSIFLVRHRTEKSGTGMPMPALVLWMPMPTYDCYPNDFREKDDMWEKGDDTTPFDGTCMHTV